MSFEYEIEVIGWKSAGPVYRHKKRLAGWRNRRNREQVEQVGSAKGKNVESAEYHSLLLDAGAEVLMFNKGHVYDVTLLKEDDTEAEIKVDAREKYNILRFNPHDQLQVVEVKEFSGDLDELEALFAKAQAEADAKRAAEALEAAGEPVVSEDTTTNDDNDSDVVEVVDDVVGDNSDSASGGDISEGGSVGDPED